MCLPLEAQVAASHTTNVGKLFLVEKLSLIGFGFSLMTLNNHVQK